MIDERTFTSKLEIEFRRIGIKDQIVMDEQYLEKRI